MPHGFQWFVAWRYMVARKQEPKRSRPRRSGTTAMFFIGSVLAVVGTVLSIAFSDSDRLVVFSGAISVGIVMMLRSLFVARFRKVSVAIFAVAGLFFLAAAACVLIAYQVLEQPGEAYRLSPGSPYIRDFSLAARGLAVLGELALVLGIIRYLFTFFTTVSIAGVAIGSMALVIVLSVMSGFETDLRDKILGSNAHVLITKENGEFHEYREVAKKIEDIKGVVAHTPYLTSEVVIAANNNYANVIIKGIDPRTIKQVTDLGRNLEQKNGLEALWPLSDEGKVVGPPSDRKDSVPQPARDAGAPSDPGADPAPGDMDVGSAEPTDFSGGELPDAGIDPAPSDMDVGSGDPIDISGGELPGGELPGDPGQDISVEPPPAIPSGKDAFGDPVIPPRIARLYGVLVGRELVKQIHLYVGQEVRIVSPLGEQTPAGPVPRTNWMRVAGIFFTGMYEYDLKFVYVELKTLQEFLDLSDQVNGIEVRITDPEATGPVVERIRERLGPEYRVQDWKEINRNLFSALKLEKIAMFLVLVIIILVASFSIIGNLIMVVVEKAKEIALLKTLGASDAGVMKLFITQGLFIGLVGTGIGVLHGLVFSYLIARFGLPLDPDVYYIDRLPIHVESQAVLAVAAAGILISVLATLYPAYIAARLRPVEGMRYE